jgi:uncharacterized protein YchJ
MGQYEKQRQLAYKSKIRDYVKVGRNQLCLCGSGLKYKNCCLKKNLVFKLKNK